MSVTSRWPVLAVLICSSVLLSACYSTQSNNAQEFPSTPSELQNSKPDGNEAGSVSTDIDLTPQNTQVPMPDQNIQQYPVQNNNQAQENPMDLPTSNDPNANNPLPPFIEELKVETVQPGTGGIVAAGDTVKAQYKGQLTNGSVFDQGTFSFEVGAGRVIQGWDQGFVGLQEGGQYRLLIPAELGYGASGAGASIPPNADLVFDVTVIEIQK